MTKTPQKLSKRIVYDTPYQQLAKKYKVSTNYVGDIARGARKAIRGKAKQIREDLEAMADSNN